MYVYVYYSTQIFVPWKPPVVYIYIGSIFWHTSIYIVIHMWHMYVYISIHSQPAHKLRVSKVTGLWNTYTLGYSPTTVTVKQQTVHVFILVFFISTFTITCIAGGIYPICIHMYSFHGLHLKVEASQQLGSIRSWMEFVRYVKEAWACDDDSRKTIPLTIFFQVAEEFVACSMLHSNKSAIFFWVVLELLFTSQHTDEADPGYPVEKYIRQGLMGIWW